MKHVNHIMLAAALSLLIVGFDNNRLNAQQNPDIKPGNPAASAQTDGASAQATEKASVIEQDTTPAVTAQAQSEGSVYSELVTRMRERIASAELESDARDKFLEQLQAAERDVSLALENQQALAQLRSRMEALTTEAEKLRAQTKPVEEASKPDVTEIPTPQLETRTATLQVQLTEEEQKLTGLQQRVEAISSTRQSLQSQLGKLTADLAALPPATGLPDVISVPLDEALSAITTAANRSRLTSEQNLQQTRLSLLDAEVSLGLPQLRTDAQDRLVKELSKELTNINAELDVRRKAESAARLQQAQKDQEQITDPSLRELAGRTAEVASLNDTLVQKEMPRWQSEMKKRKSQLEQIRSDGNKLQSRIDRFGTSGAAGVELLRFREQLPATNDIKTLLEQIETIQNALEIDRLDYREELRAAEQTMQEMAPTDDVEAINLWARKIEVLKSIIGNNVTLFSNLADLNAECQTLLSVIETWQDYVSVQAMWFPSNEVLSPTFIGECKTELTTLASRFWSEWTGSEVQISHSTWLGMLPAIAGIILLILLQRKIRVGIETYSERAAKRSCVSLKPTIRTTVLTIALSAVWPLAAIALGSLLNTQFSASTESSALGGALVLFGGLILLLNFFRHTLRSGELAEAHFEWDATLCRFMRAWLHRLMLLLGPPALFYLYLRNSPSQVSVSARVVFILLMVLTICLIVRLLHPHKSVLSRFLVTQASGLKNFRWLLTATALLIPLGLAGLSIVGYHYTAASLARRLVETIAVCMVAGIPYSILIRWLKVRRTRSALAQAQERARERAAQQDKQNAEQGDLIENADSTIPPTVTDEADLELLGLQARALIRNLILIILATTIWGIWYEVMPALRVVSEHELYRLSEQITVLVEDSGQNASPQTKLMFRAVTVGNLIMAGLTAIIMLWIVRLLPGLIEMMLLNRVTVDTGARYAILTISRYILLLTGVVIICYCLGVSWNSVQWLVAGLSVGLGFGLQEVFANFVSGLIILFERPVRIGDIVTIDGVTGVVSRIRIRATSITDWDRREYIVPNKEFVTGKVLNWTLTDTTNRYVLAIGVGYGSDTVRAREIMLEVAKDHPGILKDPAPLASFEAFGDSSLNLMLRVYLPNMDNRLGTISDLHTEIHRRFAAEGIEIPYPQRDLHIVSDKRNNVPPTFKPGILNGDADQLT